MQNYETKHRLCIFHKNELRANYSHKYWTSLKQKHILKKTLLREEKDNHSLGENICKTISDKRLVSEIYKELLRNNKTEPN